MVRILVCLLLVGLLAGCVAAPPPPAQYGGAQYSEEGEQHRHAREAPPPEPLDPRLVQRAAQKALGPTPDGSAAVMGPAPPGAILVKKVEVPGIGTFERHVTRVTNEQLRAFLGEAGE